LFSFLLESCLLALAGGLLGAAAAFCLGFVKISMMNFATWQEISFSFDPNPVVLAVAVLFAIGMGVGGGILPAWRAARVSPVEAMRV
jgi:putative ABC transport system permease protein